MELLKKILGKIEWENVGGMLFFVAILGLAYRAGHEVGIDHVRDEIQSLKTISNHYEVWTQTVMKIPECRKAMVEASPDLEVKAAE